MTQMVTVTTRRKNMDALAIYKKLSQPPKEALREITDGTLKGKTDINPQWRYKAMTEQFGLVGLGWKYEVQKLWTEKGAGNEVLAFAQVAVFVRDPETKEWSDPIVGIGGSKLINDFNRGAKSNDEGYKMAVTDAFSTSLKMIGVAADIYAGRWDGSKYLTDNEMTGSKKPQNQTPQQPAGGPDTPEQKKRINELLSSKFMDGSKIFTQADCNGIGNLRMTRTANEVIKMLQDEMQTRIKAKQAAQAAPDQPPPAGEPFQEDIPWDEPATDPVF